MYNILVVDDEPIIVQGLFDILRDAGGLELGMWKAYSAPEAIAIMEAHRIDILITDIRMIGMSGLELTRFVRKRWANCRFIFLTGHADVEYLQEALRQGAADYLLKPVDDETMLASIRTAIADIETEVLASRSMEKAREQLKQAYPMLRQALLAELLNGRVPPGDKLQDQLDALGIPLDAESGLLLMVGRVDRWPEQFSSKDMLLLEYAIGNIVDEYLSQFCRLYAATEGSFFVWLIQLSSAGAETIGGDAAKLQWYIGELLEKIQHSIRQLLQLPFSIALSQSDVGWANAHQAYAALCEWFRKGIGLDEEIIVVDRPRRMDGFAPDEVSRMQGIAASVSQLKNWLDCGEEETFVAELSRFMHEVQKNVFVDYVFQMELFCTVSGMFLSYMNARNIKPDAVGTVPLEPLSHYAAHANWSVLTAYYIRLAGELFKHANSERDDQKARLVGRIDQYIGAHLDGDLSLNHLAAQVHLSPSYLSRLYHKQKGYPLSEYITDLKIAKAKQLLQDSAFMVQDIALLLGFDNIPYFTKFFKKMTGVSPQKYKENSKV